VRIVVSGVLCGIALLALDVPALAAGKHIICPFVGSINDGQPGHNARVERTMNFYLDDTHSTLVGEGGDTLVGRGSVLAHGTTLNVSTKSYSDTWIDAEVDTGPPDGMFFGQFAVGGNAGLGINRVTGIAAYAVKLLPKGAETGVATCHEVAAPAAKF
jgi:hypothetical protein